MAIIKCYECGQAVSDKANICPHCGAPLKRTTPPPSTNQILSPNTPPMATSAVPGTNVGLHASLFQCPGCGARLESKDILSSGWAHCPKCNKDVQLTGVNNAFSDGIVEKIHPGNLTKEEFHNACMQRLMDEAPEDIFSKITKIETTKKYFWVREFGVGDNRQIHPMCEFGKMFFKNIWGDTLLNCDLYEKIWPTGQMVEFNSSIIKGNELIAKEMSSKECKHQYCTHSKNNGSHETDTYYCIPVLEESLEYKGKKYVLRAIKTEVPFAYNGSKVVICNESNNLLKNTNNYYNNIIWSNDEWPKDQSVIGQKPKYVGDFMRPFAILSGIVLIAIALWLIYLLISAWGWFWAILAIIAALALGGYWVVSIVAGLAMLPGIGLDKIIRRAINQKRRNKFRKIYEAIQLKKQSDARNLHNLNLNFTIPKWPL